MGSVSFVAVRGGDRAKVLEALGLEQCGAVQAEPWSGYQYLSMTDLPSSWLLIMSNDSAYFTGPDLDPVVACGETLALSASSVVMCSEILHFENGRRTWSVFHDPEKTPLLAVEGDLPAFARKICDDLLERQTAADRDNEPVDHVFEAPSLIAEAMCGFNIEEEFKWPLQFAALVEAGRRRKEPAKKGGLLAWLFGSF
ncbi:MAG TPA: hypothetical protein VL358_04210 [Caulobacteraceae bacterium]|jgi:hypothetical protein|nr:hypothetical protein [Caulobacteraceae bacterium]